MFGSPLTRRAAGGLLAAGVLGLAGCGGGDASVAGTVKYDGTPIDAGAITFMPAAGEGKKVGARIYDGKYTIEPTLGLAPGPYKVVVNWDKKTGKRVNTGGEGAMRDETKEGLPAKYHTSSTLTAEVKAGSNTLDFDLVK